MPPAITVSRLVPAICCCQKRTASGRNPLITSGVSMAWKLMPLAAMVSVELPARVESVPAEEIRALSIGRSRTSSICSIGVIPAMGSLLNSPMR
jgi:hypothetical protein